MDIAALASARKALDNAIASHLAAADRCIANATREMEYGRDTNDQTITRNLALADANCQWVNAAVKATK
jgi:hypothetical protein